MPLPLSRTLTAGTNENINDVQLNFNDLANAFPVQATNIGDGQITTAKLASGAVTTRKAMTVAHVSAVSSYTFSGLNGNADYGYEIIVLGVCTLNGAQRTITLRPNGVTTNNVGATRHYANSALAHGIDNVTPTGHYLFDTWAVDTGVDATIRVRAKVGLASHRSISCHSDISDTSNQRQTVDAMALWAENTTNITSIVLDFATPGTFTGMLTLRKLGEA